MALYQDIMKIPGLTGNSFQRQSQYWNKLGLGGGYKGSYDQNVKLLSMIKQPGYGIASQAAPAPVAGAGDLAKNFAEMAGAKNVYKGPVFSEVLPFHKAWETLLPTVQQEAEAQINPFIQRDLTRDLGNFRLNLAGSGGGRFGVALGQEGDIRAGAERNKKSQMLDWMGSRRQGFTDLFYNPARESFNRAIELGNTPSTPQIPTWENFMKTYNTTNGM